MGMCYMEPTKLPNRKQTEISPPQIKVASNSVLAKLTVKLLEVLVNAGWISSLYAERSQTEYADMIKVRKKCRCRRRM